MTQEQRVVEYCKKYNSITSKEAFTNLGITRLSAKIFNLKKCGYNIAKKREKSINRFGEETSFDRYFITNIMEMENLNHIPQI